MKTISENPLLLAQDLPAFDLIAAEHVTPALDHVLAQAQTRLAALEHMTPDQWPDLLAGLEQLGDAIGKVWGPVEHLLSVRDRADLRAVHDAAQPKVVEFGLQVAQNRAIYATLVAVRAGRHWPTVPATEQRAIALTIRDAELSGVGLTGAAHQRFSAVQQELAELGTRFGHHLLDATKAWGLELHDAPDIVGLPDSLLQQAAQAWRRAHPDGDAQAEATPDTQAGPWRITLDGPSAVPFLQHSPRRDLREKVWRAYVQRASSGDLDNGPLIAQILRLRQEMATLLGMASFGELSLRSKMAPSVAVVQELLERLRLASWPAGQGDLADLQALATERGAVEAKSLKPWDVAFWAERLREQKYAYNDEALRPWFPLPKVLDGLFELAQRLFGIVIVAADGQAPVWHPDVRFFRVLASDGAPVAAFYLDPYSRPEDKRGGAWMNECVGRSALFGQPGTPRLPVAYLVCNGTPPNGDQPSLMTFGEVETLLHEFGHGLQHMLTAVDNGMVSGIRGIEWDAVELPSQFMENWCYHKPTLMRLSGHVATGAPLPDDIFDRLASARTFRSGSDMLRQLLFALVDLALHDGFDPTAGKSAFDVHRAIAVQTSALPVEPDDRFLCGFSHIFAGGYAAGYYSYKWAELLSADAFAAFEEAGLDQPEQVAAAGARFRDSVLALGGAVPPAEVFRQFRGRDPDERALLRHAGLA